MDLFEPKPKLNDLHGKPLPAELLEKVRFAFIKKESAVLMGSPRKWSKHGECGMDFSDFLPHLATCADDILMIRSMHTEQFNHHPGQLLLSCGRASFGLPTIGSWLTYGLGSESENLPGYVVLTSGRGSSGGASLWTSGFLPAHCRCAISQPGGNRCSTCPIPKDRLINCNGRGLIPCGN